MTTRLGTILLVVVLMLGLILVVGWRAWSTDVAPHDWIPLARLPRIRPDYTGVVIPPNIAPLNFVVEEPGTAYHVRIGTAEGPYCDIRSRDGAIRIPPGPWKKLLAHYRGKTLPVEVYVRNAEDRWQRLDSFSWTVAQEEIDPYLAYRLLDPTFNRYMYFGIYQRNLETYEESPLIHNSSFGRGCVNCHTFSQNRPDLFLVHVRTGVDDSVGRGMVVVRDGKATRVGTRTDIHSGPAAFSSWHPSNTVVAFSLNDNAQYMHGTGTEVREVFDRNSDVAVVDLRTGVVTSNPALANPVRLETWPCWSPDGKYLYYCSAPNLWQEVEASLLRDRQRIKYDLMRISYDVATNTWGEPEALLVAAETGKSMIQPRVSPDGQYLLFCMCNHGTFPAFRAESDLYLLNLADRTCRRLEANSDRSESWHSWSSNSRWIVFASRRDNGFVAWPYLCYVDPSGQDHRPFLLPQSDPRFYDTRLNTYNLPELATGPITVSEKELVRAFHTEIPGGEPPARDASPMKEWDAARE